MRVGRWLALSAAVAAAGIAWWWHSTADAPKMPPAPSATTRLAEPSFPPVVLDHQDGIDEQTVDAAVDTAEVDTGQLWQAVRRHCPWPPLPSSWEVLGEACLSAMENLDEDGWRRPLADALDTRRAVAAALDNPECRVALAERWPGEIRPALREPCQATTMVRLAELQDHCVERLHTDWHAIYAPDHWSAPEHLASSQEEYHRLVESDNKAAARLFWETYLCRKVAPEAFEWIGALPVPPGDPTASRYERPPITQALDLYDAARRLGAEIPDWALGRLEYRAEVRRRQLADNGSDGN